MILGIVFLLFFSPSFFLIQAVFVALEAQASFLHWYGSDNPVPLCLPTMPYKSSGFRGVRACPNELFFSSECFVCSSYRLCIIRCKCRSG
uniref:Putative secreted protein n=1 Tax=Ixodes scapularis TaxID=6945 RepID=A0A4D5RF95_IXOSC